MKTNFAQIVLGFIVANVAPAAFAADTPNQPTDEPAPEQAIGLSVGWVYANGLSYRRYFGHNYVQGTMIGYYDKESSQSYIDFSVGAAHYLNRFDLDRLGPVGLKLVGGVETEYRKGTNYRLAEGESRKNLNVGLGFGADLGNPNKRGLLLSIDVFYTAAFKVNGSPEFTSFKPFPSVGVHYNI